MFPHRAAALLVIAVAASLVLAPVAMTDWSEQASFSVERVNESEIHDETPVFQYENLPPDAQSAVRAAIESPDGNHVVYGREDWPDRFFYSDNTSPGRGLYAIVYEGEYYRLYTYGSGAFPFVFWLYELPFVAYGLGLAVVGKRALDDERSAATGALLGGLGTGFHLLGPAFDFPVVSPDQFIGLGLLGAVLVGVEVVVGRSRGETSESA